ncbi:hypothetical protein [Streptomyces sp. NPDC056672]|uniref:hypothetical protein n=1 Tax=Streptomyces sp. NPDC056672 TaxID=3345906 RepID=UPI00368B4BD7
MARPDDENMTPASEGPEEDRANYTQQRARNAKQSSRRRGLGLDATPTMTDP